MEELTAEEIRIIQLLKNKNRMEQDQILSEIERSNNNVRSNRKIKKEKRTFRAVR